MKLRRPTGLQLELAFVTLVSIVGLGLLIETAIRYLGQAIN